MAKTPEDQSKHLNNKQKKTTNNKNSNKTQTKPNLQQQNHGYFFRAQKTLFSREKIGSSLIKHTNYVA